MPSRLTSSMSMAEKASLALFLSLLFLLSCSQSHVGDITSMFILHDASILIASNVSLKDFKVMLIDCRSKRWQDVSKNEIF